VLILCILSPEAILSNIIKGVPDSKVMLIPSQESKFCADFNCVRNQMLVSLKGGGGELGYLKP
jgi:hypothetical protein